ncbi:MAG: cysteine desulfurase NifS [Acidobacteriota bacterium]|jgi:cysteine desulfurase|nr:cysteine desulfurase NifS [Acidobacteriota bacterium]
MNERIYLDNSATTQVDGRVLEAMLPCFREYYGNASSVHLFGQEARGRMEEARREVAALLGADTREVVFTSGGTESDNWALWGAWRAAGGRPGAHLVTTRIEHPAILATCKALEAAGAEVTYVPVDASGRVDPAAVQDALRDTTLLVSVMHANNETGVMQPVKEVAAIAHGRGVMAHTDAVQSVGKVPTRAAELGVDLLSLSGHKIHGPKGVGVLYIRKGVKIAPYMTGGSHERKRRAGTENVPAIVGLGAAARLAGEHLPEMAGRVSALRDRFEQGVLEKIPGAHVNGDRSRRLPNISNISFDRLEGEAAVIALDLEGVAASTGSACASGALDPSHVLTAMGLRAEVVQGSLRFSLSRLTTDAEIDRALEILETVVSRLRRLRNRR